MRHTNKLAICAAIAALCFSQNFVYAQWNFGINPDGRTIPSVTRSIGIGPFTTSYRPLAALHIDTRTPFPTSPNFLPGEVFRTDCPSGTTLIPISTSWRMLRGGTPIARFFNTTGSNDFFMEAQQSGASLRFNTTSFFGTSTKMIITDGLLGFVGIGNNFLLPQSQLHINDGPFATYTQITNTATGATATDGFKVGIDATVGIAQVIQQEPQDMQFYTDGSAQIKSRMIIKGQGTNCGFVGIGQNFTSPQSLLSINGNATVNATGEVFRTNGPSTNLNAWRLWTGGQDATNPASEKGMIFNYGNNPVGIDQPNFSIQATARDMTFHTGTLNPDGVALERMRIRADGMVGIGTSIPIGRLDVTNINNNNVYGIYSRNQNISPSNNTAIRAEAISNNTTTQNYGVSALASGIALDNYGMYSAAFSSSSYNYAGFFVASLGTYNYGVYCYAPPNPITPTTPWINNNWAAYCDGDIYKGSNIYGPSDIKLKDSIQPYEKALSKIRNLKPETFIFKTSEFPSMNLPFGKQYGLIAQDVETVFPDLVRIIIHPAKYDSLGNILYDTIQSKSINYDAFIPILIEGVKELDSTITNMSSAAENGLHIDTTAGNPVKMGGVIDETTTIGLKRNLIFTSDNNYTGQVCIGSPTAAPSEALMVNNNTWMTSAKFINSKTTATDNIAAGFLATGSANNNYGGQFSGKGDGNLSNYGATFEATGHSKTNYGVYATALGGSMADYAGYFNGNLYASSYLNLPSDSKLKENIQPITNAMDIINQLQPKTFTFRASSFPSINLPAGQQYGLIAQDVSPILPTLVSTTINPAIYDSVGNMVYDTVQSKSLNYEAFIPILIQGAKEQQSKLDSLSSQITDLQNQVAQLSGNNGSNAKITNNNTINVELANDAVLYQNIPNPFGEETMINYYIPENTSNAKIIFFDMYGQSMKEVPLTETGSGNIHVDSKNLASGIYSYSLIIGGKVIDTKKMVRNK